MTQKLDAGPRDIGVRKKLWLLPSSPTDVSSGKSGMRPYQQAIEQLRCIKDHYTMLSKLECVGEKFYLSFIFIFVCGLYAIQFVCCSIWLWWVVVFCGGGGGGGNEDSVIVVVCVL